MLASSWLALFSRPAGFHRGISRINEDAQKRAAEEKGLVGWFRPCTVVLRQTLAVTEIVLVCTGQVTVYGNEATPKVPFSQRRAPLRVKCSSCPFVRRPRSSILDPKHTPCLPCTTKRERRS